MKRSYITAAVIAVSAVAWILSGQIGTKAPEVLLKADEAAPAQAAAPKVRIRVLNAQERRGDLVVFGRTEASRRVELKAETTGKAAEILVAKGERVEKGQAIVRLAMDDRKARLSEAQARAEQARIAYTAARKLSEKAFRSKVQLAEEKAALEAARASLAAAQLDISRTVIKAPFAGTLDELPAEVGDFLAVGSPVATVVDLTPILLVAEVAERDLAGLRLGGVAQGRLISGRRLAGDVTYISKTGAEATRTFRVEVSAPNSGELIPEGLTVELHLQLDAQMAHRLSPAVLTLSSSGQVGLKAVDAQGRVIFYPVELVADTVDGVWLSGLPNKVSIITVGQEFVRVGQQVTPVSEGRPDGDL